LRARRKRQVAHRDGGVVDNSDQRVIDPVIGSRVGSDAIVAAGSWRIVAPLLVRLMSNVQLVLYPTAGHSVKGGVGVGEAHASLGNAPGEREIIPAEVSRIALITRPLGISAPQGRDDHPFLNLASI